MFQDQKIQVAKNGTGIVKYASSVLRGGCSERTASACRSVTCAQTSTTPALALSAIRGIGSSLEHVCNRTQRAPPTWAANGGTGTTKSVLSALPGGCSEPTVSALRWTAPARPSITLGCVQLVTKATIWEMAFVFYPTKQAPPTWAANDGTGTAKSVSSALPDGCSEPTVPALPSATAARHSTPTASALLATRAMFYQTDIAKSKMSSARRLDEQEIVQAAIQVMFCIIQSAHLYRSWLAWRNIMQNVVRRSWRLYETNKD